MEYPIFAWANLILFSQYSNILIGWLHIKEDGKVVTDRSSLLFLFCKDVRMTYKDIES
jgi:hypothetical protein